MLKFSSNRRIRIDVPVLSISWSIEDHSVIIQALRKGLVEREASDTGGVPRWTSSCPDRLAEATGGMIEGLRTWLGYVAPPIMTSEQTKHQNICGTQHQYVAIIEI